jgi:heptose I phosphotransferase
MSPFFVRADYVAAFERLGWNSVQAVMKSSWARVFRQIGERDNSQVHFGRGKTDGFLKRHWSRSRGEWIRECRLTGASGPPAWRETEAIQLCRQAGIATPSIIAAGWQLRGAIWQSDSFLITEAVDGLAADEYARCPTLDIARRRALLISLARTARRLHQAGLVHRDLYWCHFFVREDPVEGFAVTLIDLQRVFRPRRRLWRWKLKDLAQFVFSMPKPFANAASLKTWFCAYLDKPRLGWRDRLALHAIRARAALYRLREGST